MTITLTIQGNTLDEVFRKIGTGPFAVQMPMPPAEGEMTRPTTEPCPPVDNSGQPQPTSADSGEAGKRGPGRPRRNSPAAEATAPALTWQVRRFDGHPDGGAFTDSGQATERLVELVHNAADIEAIDALVKANADLVTALPAERREEVNDAIARARAAVAQAAAAAQPGPATQPAAQPTPAAPAMAWKDIDGNPMAAVTPDRRGALSVVKAIASGPAPTFGFNVAKALLDRCGAEKVSAITDDADPRLAKIAREGAAMMGLPVSEPAGADALT